MFGLLLWEYVDEVFFMMFICEIGNISVWIKWFLYKLNFLLIYDKNVIYIFYKLEVIYMKYSSKNFKL